MSLPFEQNIPQFDENNVLHMKIASAGAVATKEALTVAVTSRAKTKKAITSMATIDKLVSKLIS